MNVLGRPLYARELYRGLAAEKLIRIKAERAKSLNFVAWAHANPQDAELLAKVEILLNG